MEPNIDDDVERGSPHQNDKDLPPDPRFEQGTARESRLIVEEPQEIQPPSSDGTFLFFPEERQSELTIYEALEANTQFQEQVQELQRELSDFLAQHVAKTLNLQNSLHNDPLKLRKRSSTVRDGDNGEYPSVLLL